MHEIVITQRMVKQNQSVIITITNKDCKRKCEILTEVFLKKKKTYIENAEEIDTKICLKKINKKKVWKNLS